MPTTHAPPSTATNITLYFPTSSPPDDPAILQSRNQAFLAEISKKNIETPIKVQVRRLTGITERFQVDITIMKADMKEVKAVQSQRKGKAESVCLIKIALFYLLRTLQRNRLMST